jgi:hypothetical protein
LIENVVLRDIMLKYPMIEDPRPMVAGSGSSQFPKINEHPEAVGAWAAIVADNIKNLVVENISLQWPATTVTPAMWAHAERIENGSRRIHRMNYSKARQAEFGVLWGNRLQGGYLNNIMAQPSAPVRQKYTLTNSSIEIIR